MPVVQCPNCNGGVDRPDPRMNYPCPYCSAYIPPDKAGAAATSSTGSAAGTILYIVLVAVAVVLAWLVFGIVGLAVGLPIGLIALFVGRTKMCPQCGERIRHAAKVCRYCRANL